MIIRVSFVVVFGLLYFSCSAPKDRSSLKGEISGTYVRQYSFKVINQETGKEIGMRTIRDTIFINPFNEEFEVSNHKWARNDYDSAEWRSMEHMEDRPLVTMQCKFDEKIEALTDLRHSPTLYLDLSMQRLSLKKESKDFFEKVN